jgi:hypothetical protein
MVNGRTVKSLTQQRHLLLGARGKSAASQPASQPAPAGAEEVRLYKFLLHYTTLHYTTLSLFLERERES